MTPLEWIMVARDHAELIVGDRRNILGYNDRLKDLRDFLHDNPYVTGCYGDYCHITQNELDDGESFGFLKGNKYGRLNSADVYQGETIALDAESIIKQIRANPSITADGIIEIIRLEIANQSPEVKDPPTPILEQRLPVISEAIKRLGYPPLSIPYGGKAGIMGVCLNNLPELFNKNTFDEAWKAGKKTKPQLWEVKNVEKFKNN